jgi:hypothetical protein
MLFLHYKITTVLLIIVITHLLSSLCQTLQYEIRLVSIMILSLE